MPCRSRQAKKSSRARQQCARVCRSGASKAPSAEGRAGGGEVVVVVGGDAVVVVVVVVKKPIW